ncbi:glycoside hydrolase family 43 protein [Nocardioides guangzhouensis]|uniref:glycoside hydrolase family 43 protein n=1 Tax=Nocardioides guangzhouensis TaxID=2497878 RepID=UPI0014384C11|nr:glycoside hydrolase family 43 protein [Nocardioides guangzhouensis]
MLAIVVAGVLTLVGAPGTAQAEVAVESVGVAHATGPAHRRPPAKGTVEERFVAGRPYTGTWADPTVMRVGRHWVAAATTTGGLHLPVMTSSDLRTWRPRPPLPHHRRFTARRQFNDGLPVKSRWSLTVRHRSRHTHRARPRMSQWAPSLARAGHRYLAAYSAAVALKPTRRSCIGIATAAHPLGPYRDTRRRPLVCYRRSARGVIDPEIFRDPATGRRYLLWKQEGIAGKQRPMLMTRRLDVTGTRFKAGSRPVRLLALRHRWVRSHRNGARYVRKHTWEGRVVENPSMVRFRGRLYLFYSGNAYATKRYATGYAICRTPVGPCRRPVRRPVLTSRGRIAGPGGADAFVGRAGRLRLMYASWDAGRVRRGNGTRRMHIATLRARRNGTLVLLRRR